ncbi:MAG: Z1 domain-containing protein [Phycisphaerales bacterium JB040]
MKAAIRESTLSILERCLNPNDPEDASKTGLVVGYVQSGKTLSFTAVAAAAHDNGYRTVVVLAGSKLNLAAQNKDRLAKDLGVHQDFTRPWVRAHNPTLNTVETLRTGLQGWDHGRGRSLLLTALKHQSHVRNLGDVLEALGEAAQPVLIIDDEADQISLNTKVNQNDTSPNYSQILSLRDKVQRHTYLGYTATPQAVVFIPLWDQLSPDFCELLEPGAAYVGGRHFFINRRNQLVQEISQADLQLADQLQGTPDSLNKALREFYLGVVQGILEWEDPAREGVPKNRSMMVHPASAQASHEFFARCIRVTKDSWLRLLDEPETDPDRQILLTEFAQSYADLQASDTNGKLYPFEQIVSRLREWIAVTQIAEVNSRRGVDKRDWSTEWGTHYSWILVGGQNLDRGFTVEGLTVTYMPRNVGGGQADTLQQRARFFGYKAGYADLCRIYLGADALRGFCVYVSHEASMRSFLERNKDKLKDPSIPRQFELDTQLQPTRRQVLQQYPRRQMFNEGWLFQRGLGARIERCRHNGRTVLEFEQSMGGGSTSTEWPWIADTSRIRNDHRHRVLTEVNLTQLYESVLSLLVMPDGDEHLRWQVALDMIRSALESDGGLTATVVVMRPDSKPFRGLEDGSIKTVAAGAHPGAEPYAYLGDRRVRCSNVTLQLHCFDVGHGANSESSQGRTVLHQEVPTIALWLDDAINKAYIQQDQSQQ